MEPGSVIEGRYVVEDALASGGMATVYRVRHQALDSLHALKILHLPTPDIRERLLLEGRLQAKLRHPHIVAVTDVLTIHGNPGLVMEYVDGPSLDAWLLDHSPSPEQVEQLFLGILAAVDHAHQHGVVHRDLKPANVLLSPLSGGVIPKVTDFGIARVIDDVLDAKSPGRSRTRSGVMMGTPAYMAPEQSESASDAGPEADLFALGCILFEMTFGAPAFTGPHLGAILLSVASEDYPDPQALDPDVRPGVAEAIRRTLVADPKRRIATCGELAAVLTEGRVTTLSGHTEAPVPAPMRRTVPQTPTTPQPRSGPGQRTLLAGLAVGGMTGLAGIMLLTAGLALTLGWWWDQRQHQTAPDPVVVAPPTQTIPPEPAPPEPVNPDPGSPEPATPAPVTPVREPSPPVAAPEPVTVAPAPSIPVPSPDPAPVVAPRPAPTTVPEPAPAVVAPEPVEPAEGPWSVTVENWYRAADTAKNTVLTYRAAPGQSLVLVDVAVRYTGPSPVEPTNPWRLVLRGGPVEASSRCGIAVPNGLSSLARYKPESVVRGTLCFEVPEGARPKRVEFSSGLEAGGVIAVPL